MKNKVSLLTFKKSSALIQAAVIALASLLPVMLLSGSASGAQLVNRKIDMSATQTSAGSGRSGSVAAGQNVTYTVSFELASAHSNLEGIVIDFCTDSPIVGDVCTGANADGFDLNTWTVGNSTGTLNPTSWSTTGSDADTLVLSDATGVAGVATNTVTFDITGIDNPATEGTFYARIVTFTTDTVAQAYDSGTVNANNPGANTDEGGIALSVANELTITARVQEVLEFCIGTEVDSALAYATGEDCSDVAGTDLDLEVVDSNSIATTSSIGTPNDGLAMLRTNASVGAVMYYKAEQNTSSGKLKIAGSACSGSSFADPCFNSVGTSRTAITAGTENFGLALKDRVTTTGGATNAVTCNADYRGDGTAGCTGAVAGNNYAWDDSGAFDTLASSSGPVDDELVALQFAATASPTTPTGLYTVTANFVATATF